MSTETQETWFEMEAAKENRANELRNTWLTEVTWELLRIVRSASISADRLVLYHSWAEEIAETHYDPCPGEVTPKTAAMEAVLATPGGTAR